MKLGEIVQAKVIERVLGETYIVNFNGRLLRVVNSSGKKLQASQIVKLKVTAVNPLAFQIVDSTKNISIQI